MITLILYTPVIIILSKFPRTLRILSPKAKSQFPFHLGETIKMLTLFLYLYQVDSQSCPIYSCHEGGFDISPVCARLTGSNDFQLQVCDQPGLPYCDVTGTITKNYSCVSGPPYNYPQSYPGEVCRSNSDCVSGQCVDNYCQGQSPGGSCVGNQDCDAGFYCGPGFFCVPQLFYGATCSNDFQCQNNLACNRTLFEDGTCVYYFSIPVGKKVGMCIDMLTEGVSNLCASGSCRVLSDTDSVGVCSNPVYAPSLTYPRICFSDSDCQGSDGAGYTATGVCSCGMDQHGFAYCDSFSGDPPSQTLQYLYELHVNSTGILSCHTQRRFDVYCLSQNLGPAAIHLWTKMQQLATDTARYQGNDYCASIIFNNQFHDVSHTECQAYGCANLNGWESGTCIAYTQGTNSFAINPCDSQSNYPYCDYTKAENSKWRNITCGPTPIVIVRYPGESCKVNTDCLSESCTNFICDGTAQGGACSSSSECDIGLYCVSKDFKFTCQPLIQAYNFGCGSDYDCVQYSGCQYTSSGPPGTCIPYFSLAIGQVTPCNNGVSLLCSTGACYGSGFTGTCALAPTSSLPLGTSCNYNGQCNGKNAQRQTFAGTCTCGYNNQGLSYCNPFLGDAPGIAYLKEMKKYYKAGGAVNSCQTTRRFSPDCYASFSSTFESVYLNFTQMPLFLGNDQCVKSVYTAYYWNNLKPPTPPAPVPKPFDPPYEPGGKQRVDVKHDWSVIMTFAVIVLII